MKATMIDAWTKESIGEITNRHLTLLESIVSFAWTVQFRPGKLMQLPSNEHDLCRAALSAALQWLDNTPSTEALSGDFAQQRLLVTRVYIEVLKINQAKSEPEELTEGTRVRIVKILWYIVSGQCEQEVNNLDSSELGVLGLIIRALRSAYALPSTNKRKMRLQRLRAKSRREGAVDQ